MLLFRLSLFTSGYEIENCNSGDLAADTIFFLWHVVRSIKRGQCLSEISCAFLLGIAVAHELLITKCRWWVGYSYDVTRRTTVFHASVHIHLPVTGPGRQAIHCIIHGISELKKPIGRTNRREDRPSLKESFTHRKSCDSKSRSNSC